MIDTKTKVKANLVLENGMTLCGWSFGYQNPVAGEVVFNTAMTGYPESLTDPSYFGQILVLTFPLIGNYGVPEDIFQDGLSKHFESEKIHVSGLIISDYSFNYSHWNAKISLSDWLIQHRIPAIYGIDTRQLTKILRESGTMKGYIRFNDLDMPEEPSCHFVDAVSIREIKTYGKGRSRIVLIDCGVKHNIIRNLIDRDATVIRVPWNYDFFQEEFDGIVVSNGPGDPKACVKTIENLKKALNAGFPMLGICLGHQLISLAAGADTYKLKYGHRSHNQPVMIEGTQRVYLTSQNHGYAVHPESLGNEWKIFCTNLNDHTNEGIKHRELPVFSVQFHPEASGGPADTMFLFDNFFDLVKKWMIK